MSRQINPSIAPADLRLWRYENRIVPFPTAGLKVPLSSQGTNLVEFLFIEADLSNTDFIAIGLANVQLYAAATTGTTCITQLAPGDWIQWQSESVPVNGRLTARDGDVAAVSLVPELDRIDLSQIFGLSGPNFTPNTLHLTIGVRTR